MIKIKQLFGIIFFICIYEIISLHPYDAEFFGLFDLNYFKPTKYFQFYNPKNLFFYLAPIILVNYVISLVRIFKENTSSFWRIFAYILISIYLVVEMFDFLINYNPFFLLNFNFDWYSILENLGFTLTEGSLRGFMWVIFSGIIQNLISKILIILILLMIMFIPIISYITLRKQIKTAKKIREEIKEQTKISKNIFFIKPMSLIFIKQRLRFFKDFDKKQIYRKDPSYFQEKKKKVIKCFSCGLFLLIIWILLNLLWGHEGGIYIPIYDTGIYFGYFSIWVILPFRIMFSLLFGYGLSL